MKPENVFDPSPAPAPGRPKRSLFISWSPFSRRIASMEPFFNFETRYFPPPVARKWLKPLGYFRQAFQTARTVLEVRPEEVWLHCPPTFLPHLLLALRPFAGPYRLVADCHHRAFVPRWRRIPGVIGAINRCDVILVHNVEALPTAEALGVDMTRTVMLEDPPPLAIAPAPAPAAPAGEPPYVLTPCSFSDDEPIPILLAAARLLPEARILITGSRRKAEGLGFTRDAPPNVRFTDYLPLQEFERLLNGAAVVMGLTDAEGIQLSVANEALGADKALVLSDTRILRAMFADAALFARNTPEDLAARLREALARRPELEARSAALKARRLQDWRVPAEVVARMLA